MAGATKPSRAVASRASLHADAALAVLVVRTVFVLADPALRLVLHGAGAAFDPLLSGDAVAVGEILDCVGTAASQQHEQERSSHTLSTELTPGSSPPTL